jgi:hypothetical protein
MNALEHFEVLEGYAVARPEGRVRLEQGTQLVTQAIARAREARIDKLLFNATGLTGFPSPSLAERYFFVREWARAAQGSVRVVLVVRAEMIDPEKFGMTVARNFGMKANVFPTEPEALAWLSGDED